MIYSRIQTGWLDEILEFKGQENKAIQRSKPLPLNHSVWWPSGGVRACWVMASRHSAAFIENYGETSQIQLIRENLKTQSSELERTSVKGRLLNISPHGQSPKPQSKGSRRLCNCRVCERTTPVFVASYQPWVKFYSWDLLWRSICLYQCLRSVRFCRHGAKSWIIVMTTLSETGRNFKWQKLSLISSGKKWAQ